MDKNVFENLEEAWNLPLKEKLKSAFYAGLVIGAIIFLSWLMGGIDGPFM